MKRNIAILMALGFTMLLLLAGIFASEGLFPTDLIKVFKPRGSLCPVSNSTYSFCFIKDGKAHYFEISGWVTPNETMMENLLKKPHVYRFGGLIFFLAVKTNLDWRSYSVAASCKVGELYKNCFYGHIDFAIPVKDAMILIPFTLGEIWESYKIVREHYLNASNIRLKFYVYKFLEVTQLVKIGKICLEPSDYDPYELDIYVEYPPPNFHIDIKNVTYLGFEEGWYQFNITLHLLGDVGMYAYYEFNEFGQKETLSEEMLPIYLLTVEESLTGHELWFVETINETHNLYAIPTTAGSLFGISYRQGGGGFKDVWSEPQHEYLGSYLVSGNYFWIVIDVYSEYLTNNTLVFVTPWETFQYNLPA